MPRVRGVFQLALTTCLMFWGTSFAQAATVTVTSIAGSSNVTPGVWFETDVRPGGTATIVNLTGAGGNLESGQPLPTGAVKLTTDPVDTNAKAEIGINDSFGTAADVLSPNFALGYSFYKENVGAPAPAPSIKLSFLAPGQSGDNFVTLIYEAYLNPLGQSPQVPVDTWTNVSLDSTHGLFWSNGGIGLPNGFGGGTLHTLTDWINLMTPTDKTTVNLVSMQVGVGSNNLGQVGYFDGVHIAVNNIDTTYDFQVQAVPEPSAFVIFGLLGMAFAGRAWRSRRESNETC